MDMAPTAERVRGLLSYDEATGVFTWKSSGKGRRKSLVAGGAIRRGYERICVDGKQYQAHRLAWLYVYGRWPADQLDHINGDRRDNRIANLRECDAAENQQNLKVSKRNTSGFMGVSPYRDGRWAAHIQKDNRHIYLGIFERPQDAHEEYKKAKAKLHQFCPELRAS